MEHRMHFLLALAMEAFLLTSLHSHQALPMPQLPRAALKLLFPMAYMTLFFLLIAVAEKLSRFYAAKDMIFATMNLMMRM